MAYVLICYYFINDIFINITECRRNHYFIEWTKFEKKMVVNVPFSEIWDAHASDMSVRF